MKRIVLVITMALACVLSYGQSAKQVLDKTAQTISNKQGITAKFNISGPNFSPTDGTIQVKGKKIAEFYVTADNLLNKAYQNHLSRLKYADVNVVTGCRGVYNMGRNITFKIVLPIAL